MWSRRVDDQNILIIRSLNRYSDDTYALTVMYKDAISPYALWSIPITTQVSSYISEDWQHHRVLDDKRREWVNAYSQCYGQYQLQNCVIIKVKLNRQSFDYQSKMVTKVRIFLPAIMRGSSSRLGRHKNFRYYKLVWLNLKIIRIELLEQIYFKIAVKVAVVVVTK